MDRNFYYADKDCDWVRSLSARRAWIEMAPGIMCSTTTTVALRKESVDRNKYVVQCRKTLGVSLSARRAWIEIQTLFGAVSCPLVALRKESVDRNVRIMSVSSGLSSRSPQGERG